MPHFAARTTYPSGLTYSYEYRRRRAPNLSFGRIDSDVVGDWFIIKTYDYGNYKPEKGASGLHLRIDQETMESIVRAYRELFPER